jgi:hypothetical protein
VRHCRYVGVMGGWLLGRVSEQSLARVAVTCRQVASRVVAALVAGAVAGVVAGCATTASVSSAQTVAPATSNSGSTATTLPCGNLKIQGEAFIRHCGAASASVTIGGRTIQMVGGDCGRRTNVVRVDIGTQLVDEDRQGLAPNYEHFSLLMGSDTPTGTNDGPVTSDGTYPVGPLAVTAFGQSYGSGAVTATLTGGRTMGTFRATGDHGESIAGSFKC